MIDIRSNWHSSKFLSGVSLIIIMSSGIELHRRSSDFPSNDAHRYENSSKISWVVSSVSSFYKLEGEQTDRMIIFLFMLMHCWCYKSRVNLCLHVLGLANANIFKQSGSVRVWTNRKRTRSFNNQWMKNKSFIFKMNVKGLRFVCSLVHWLL